MFAECAAIPVLSTTIPKGESWLCCAVTASAQNKNRAESPQLHINNNQVVIRAPGSERQLSFIL
ncbi:hypothetical protein D3C76_1431740 [compost metagenome]